MKRICLLIAALLVLASCDKKSKDVPKPPKIDELKEPFFKGRIPLLGEYLVHDFELVGSVTQMTSEIEGVMFSRVERIFQPPYLVEAITHSEHGSDAKRYTYITHPKLGRPVISAVYVEHKPSRPYTVNYFYDKAGNMVLERRIQGEKVEQEVRYMYDYAKREVSIRIVRDGVESPKNQPYCAQDKKGRIAWIYTYLDGQPSQRNDYQYDDLGNIVQTEQTTYANKSSVKKVTKFKYNREGLVTSSETLLNGSVESKQMMEYELDRESNWTRKTVKSYDGKGELTGTLVTKRTITYKKK